MGGHGEDVLTPVVQRTGQPDPAQHVGHRVSGATRTQDHQVRTVGHINASDPGLPSRQRLHAQEATGTITDHNTDMLRRSDQAERAIRRRLDQIWAAAGARDFETLESFHLYGPKFTSVKNAAPREDAAANAAGERAMFSMLEGPQVDMRDLAVNIFGDVGIATFNGYFTGLMNGSATELGQQGTMVFVSSDDGWELVHEHFSPLATFQQDWAQEAGTSG